MRRSTALPGVLIAIAASLAICAASVFAMTSTAVAQEVKGRVMLRRGTATGALYAGQILNEGDRLTSGIDGSALIGLGDHTIRMGPNTSMLILKSRPTEREFGIFLWLGRLWFTVRQAVEAMDFAVETPAATAGVRGTVFTVTVAMDGTTRVAVSEGRVDVRERSSNQAVALAAGFQTVVRPGGHPETPSVYNAEEEDQDEVKSEQDLEDEGGEPDDDLDKIKDDADDGEDKIEEDQN